MKLYIGCHLSIAKGFLHMGCEALDIAATTFQFFLRSPRASSARPMNEKDALALKNLCQRENITHLMAHAPYLLNPASPREEVRAFSLDVFRDDLKRLEHLPHSYYNFHPGCHGGQGTEKGIELIAQLLNAVMTPQMTTTVLLETMTGKGTEIGGRFEEIRQIIDRVNLKDKIGVCLDTCHVFDAGYDLVDHLDEVLSDFDRIIGLDKLKAVHLNDSQSPLGSRKDRHAKLGEGSLGLEAISRLVNHPSLGHLPFYLETPNDLKGYAREIALVKNLQKN